MSWEREGARVYTATVPVDISIRELPRLTVIRRLRILPRPLSGPTRRLTFQSAGVEIESAGAGHEAHLSAEQSPSQAHTRVPCTHGHQGWPSRPEPTPRQGPQASRGLSPTVPRRRTAVAHGFPRSRRLTDKPQFDAVHARGLRSSDAYFLVVARENTLGHPRLGLAVGVRAAGNAVHRNRLKRLLREWFRYQQDETPALDIVVNARAAAARADNATLATSLVAHWQKIRQRCERS